jgi:hypothetical protein
MPGNSWGDGHESAASRYHLRHGDSFHLLSVRYRTARLSEREMEKRALRLRRPPNQLVAAAPAHAERDRRNPRVLPARGRVCKGSCR